MHVIYISSRALLQKAAVRPPPLPTRGGPRLHSQLCTKKAPRRGGARGAPASAGQRELRYAVVAIARTKAERTTSARSAAAIVTYCREAFKVTMLNIYIYIPRLALSLSLVGRECVLRCNGSLRLAATGRSAPP